MSLNKIRPQSPMEKLSRYPWSMLLFVYSPPTKNSAVDSLCQYISLQMAALKRPVEQKIMKLARLIRRSKLIHFIFVHKNNCYYCDLSNLSKREFTTFSVANSIINVNLNYALFCSCCCCLYFESCSTSVACTIILFTVVIYGFL